MSQITAQPMEATGNETLVNLNDMLAHWQGHRRLTRKVIEAFPEDKLFSFSIGGMRPFAEMVQEFLDMAEPGMRGILTGEWTKAEDMPHYLQRATVSTKEELLGLWDAATATIEELWKQVPAKRFRETDLAFGQWQMPIYSMIAYFIDNEIHHRGEAYVYLRALGIEPPMFWDRS